MDLDQLVTRLRAGEPRALARALSLIETRGPEAREVLSRIFAEPAAADTSTVIGLTGPPGVGKSTLSDALARHARQQNRNVAILAVDPTSPFTGGALLGDRARMDTGANDPEVFIRSMATRGHVGGLSSAAFEFIVLVAAAGKDFILVETVGAGQDEVEVAAAVDVTVVVLAPGLGDRLQASKAGILEIADVVVVNKADRDGANVLAEELHAHGVDKPILKTVATKGEGVEELFAALRAPGGSRRLMEAWLWNVVQTLLRDRIPDTVWKDCLRRVTERKETPYDAAERILRSLQS